MKIAYFDCFSGISGDMILGALIHLGVPPALIEEKIGGLPLPGFHLETKTAGRMNIHGRQVRVIVEDKDKTARRYSDIEKLIRESELKEKVKQLSLKVFARLAEIEASIHNCPKEEVHFHELGGADAIVDIVGAALAMDQLEIEKTFASEIPLGKGFTRCQHGTLPVPAPATLALLHGVPVYGTGIPHELVTPTGAAIITCVAENFGPMPRMRISQIGYGAGSRELEEVPNMLRVVIGEAAPAYETDCVTVVETNIDDMNAEIFGFVMDRLFDDGALDVAWLPISMKKNRPGTMIHVICEEKNRSRIIERILSETTATGVRYYKAERCKLPRKRKTAVTSFGNVNVKEILGPEGAMSIVPEYEDCKRIALEKNIPLKAVYQAIVKEISR